MSSTEDLERRLTDVEREVITLRERINDTHTLAAHADRDVAEFRNELRAQTRLISAVRETQVEQGRTLAEHGRTLAEHGHTLAEVKADVAEVKADVAEVKAGLAHVVRLLEGRSNDPAAS